MTTPQVTTFKPSDTICSKVNVRPASKAKNLMNLSQTFRIMVNYNP